MNGMLLRLAVRLVHAWTRVYTAGLAPDLRDRRRAEIDSDLWESRGQSPGPSVPALLLRALLGVPDDLAWRRSCSGASRLVRVAVIGVIAVCALAAGLLFSVGRAAVLPAPPKLTQSTRPLPPPPPPPPPPCVPAGLGRRSPSPCSR